MLSSLSSQPLPLPVTWLAGLTTGLLLAESFRLLATNRLPAARASGKRSGAARLATCKRRNAEGVALVTEALTRGPVGPYRVQAAIAAVPDEAETVETTDWPQILALYDLLATLSPRAHGRAQPGR